MNPPDRFDDDDWQEPKYCATLAGFAVGECARLIALPADIRSLPRRERREYQALIGERFEIFALFAPDEVQLARECPGPGGEPGFEVFTMPIDCIEPAEFDPDPEEEPAEPVTQ